MSIQKTDIFQDVTIRICGSLNIDEALYDSFSYLKKKFPLDHILLAAYDSKVGAVRWLAEAGGDGGKVLDETINISKDGRSHLDEFIKDRQMARLIDVTMGSPAIYRDLAVRLHTEATSSALTMKLRIRDTLIGVVIFVALGNSRYTEKHTQLMENLRIPFAIAMSNALRYQDLLKLSKKLAEDNRDLQDQLRVVSGDKVIGADLGLKPVMEMVRKVAPLECPVLLLGETGVGKEVISNQIHQLSKRKDGPMVKINCGAIPPTLIDTELFGHEKGSFSGAIARKRGRLERAQKGTVFLDEIGELPLSAQVKLLRFLQNKEIERVGGSETITLDVRVIAATNRDLEAMVKNEYFRNDLWYRLNVFPILIPPLRDHKEDIPALAKYLLEKKANEMKMHTNPVFASGAIEEFMEYDWPGNIRELQNTIEKALILSHGNPINFPELGGSWSVGAMTKIGNYNQKTPTLDSMTSDYIKHILEITNGKIEGKGGAAEILKIKPNTLRNRMKKLGVPYGRKAKAQILM